MGKQKQEEKNPIKILTELVEADKRISFFKEAVTKSIYVTFSNNDIEYTTRIGASYFENYLRVIFNQNTKEYLHDSHIESFQKQFIAKYDTSNLTNEFPVFGRIGVDENGTHYYKLRDNAFVEYGKKGYKILDKSPVKFIKNDKLLEQVDPDFSADVAEIFDIINDNFNIDSYEEVDVFIAWLIYCFIAESSFQKVNHHILLVTGEQGSGKSTALEMICKIVAPLIGIFNDISDKDKLINKLSNSYLSTFDNIRKLSNDKQDTLCRACTGGTETKRKLYTDNDFVEINYKSIVVINGISNNLGSNSDFFERCININLVSISDTSRKSAEEVWETFNNSLPKLLGIIFKLIPKVLKEIPKVKLDKAPRFKDFAIFGTALFNIIDPEISFMDSYWKVIEQTKQLAIEGDTIIETLAQYMEEYHFEGIASKLVFELEDYAETNNIILPSNIQPNKMSELLKQYEGALKNEGITIERKKSNGKRIIKLYK